MKPATKSLLRTLIRLVDQDVAELQDSCVQADERAGAAMRLALELADRIGELEARTWQTQPAATPLTPALSNLLHRHAHELEAHERALDRCATVPALEELAGRVTELEGISRRAMPDDLHSRRV